MAGGVRKNDLPPGTRITISGHPMKDGRPAANWTVLTREDGAFFNWRTPGQD